MTGPSTDLVGMTATSPLLSPVAYVPMVGRNVGMGEWKLILPELTINKALNPVAGAAGNFAAVGGSATRVTTYAKWGVYSYRVQTAANNQGMTLTLGTLANAIHYVTMTVRGTLPADWDWSLDNANWTEPALLLQIDDDWALYGLQFPAAQANGSTTLRVYQDGAGAGDFYVDGVQVEEKSYWTTLAMGELAGCEWLGAAHASASQRSAQSRAGGRVRDFSTDYGFSVAKDVGTGVMPVLLNVDDYALQPGGELDSIKLAVRQFSLIGPLVADDGDLDGARQDLELALLPNVYPKDEGGWQPVRIWYTGAEVVKEIAAHYQSGLEVAEGIEESIASFENLALRFRATDPFWYEIGESSQVLDTNDSATAYYVAAKLRSTGQWSAMGITNVPGGLLPRVFATAVGPDGKVYFGGDFTAWNGVANRNYLVRYDPQTLSWETVGGLGDVTGVVYALAFAPDGTLYAGGTFLNLAGIAAADYLAQYDIATNTWSAVSAGGTNTVYALAFGLDGLLYFGGSFTNWNAIADADYIASWNGAAYAAVGGPANGQVNAIAIHPNGDVYIGGLFTTVDGVTAGRIARWDHTTWYAVADDSLNNTVETIAISRAGIVYAGGSFTNASSDADADYLASTNGQMWRPLGSPPNNTVNLVKFGPDDILFATGLFTEVGGTAVAQRAAQWNGSSWAQLDIRVPSIAEAFETGPLDPVVSSNYDMYISFYSFATAYWAGSVDIEISGTAGVYPRFAISRSGGTSAALQTVRNETLGRTLLFDYDLLDGEELQVDLDPLALSIVSSMFGPRLDATLAGDDFGQWYLQPGENQVTCFVDEAGAPTVLAYLLWRDAYVGKN